MKNIYYIFQGLHWEHINSPHSLVAISIYSNVIWAAGRKGELYYREGVTQENPSGSNWKLIEAPKCTIPFTQKTGVGAKLVSLTRNAAWVILTNGIIAVRTDVSKDLHEGKQWKYLTGINNMYKWVKY